MGCPSLDTFWHQHKYLFPTTCASFTPQQHKKYNLYQRNCLWEPRQIRDTQIRFIQRSNLIYLDNFENKIYSLDDKIIVVIVASAFILRKYFDVQLFVKDLKISKDLPQIVVSHITEKIETCMHYTYLTFNNCRLMLSF